MSGAQLTLIGSGALIGLGVFLLVRALLVVEQPQLAAALARLDGSGPPLVPAAGDGSGGDGWAHAAGRPGAWVVARLAATGVRIPAQELSLIGWTPEGFLLRKVGMAGFGAVFAPLLSAVLSVAGTTLPVAAPAAGSLLLAAGLFFVPDWVARDQAAEARGQMRRALCSYLDLVSLRRDASEGPTIALERAAALGDGWVFRRLRGALITARMAGEQPWDGLRRLAEDTGVNELTDVAGIASIAAVEGASIAPTLRARADSLRMELLTEEEALANTASEKLTAPVALLSVAFLLLFLYPAMSTLMAS